MEGLEMMLSEYAKRLSSCCGEILHRPAGSADPFFCASCGQAAPLEEYDADQLRPENRPDGTE